MSESSGILYQNTSYCLSCWDNSKQRLQKIPFNHFINNEPSKDVQDKKVSLKKYHNNRLKMSEYRLSINQGVPLQSYSKTARVPQNRHMDLKLGSSPIKITFCNGSRPATYEQKNSNPSVFAQENSIAKVQGEFKQIRSVICRPESKLMTKTTKFERIIPSKGQQLKKTKKNVPFDKFISLMELKESVCSYNQSCHQPERLEESQIEVDYFHPNENRLKDIEEYMREKGIQRTESFHRQKRIIK